MPDFRRLDSKANGLPPGAERRLDLPRKLGRRGMFLFALISSVLAPALISSPLVAQEPSFVAQASAVDLTPQQSAVLSTIKSLPTTLEAVVVRLNTDALLSGDRISIPLDSKSVSIINNSRRSLDGSTIWSGSAPNEVNGSTTLVANKQNVIGSIQTESGLYQIRPLGDGLHALVKVNNTKSPPEHPVK